MGRKTQRQARSISNLFVKFIVQDQRILDVNLLLQKHVGAFVDFLRRDIYVHYGKSVRDEQATIQELRDKGRSVAEAKRGISPDTLNRHLTFLDQIFGHGAARGVTSFDSISLKKLRVKAQKRDAKRARNARPKLQIESARAFIMKLRVITDHLEPCAINLMPWIVNKEVAPFSQPSRSKRLAPSADN